METVTLTAPDISCEHCQRTIEQELGSLPGIHSVSVDIPRHEVRVMYDPAAASRDGIVTKLDEEGYPVTA